MFRSRARVIGPIVAASVASMTLTAHASSVAIQSDTGGSTEGLGAFTGLITYTYDSDAELGQLVVDLTNTSDPGNGGFLTAFVFNIDSEDEDASALLTDATHGVFENLSGNTLNAPPFGEFEGGAGLYGSFLGGGNPNSGVAVGEAGSFSFDIEAEDAMFLDAIDFITGDELVNFLVRFRGFEDGGSDKVPGVMIPTPHAALLGLAGMGALVVTPRRRRP